MGIFKAEVDPKEVIRQKKRTAGEIGTRMFALFYMTIASIVIAVISLFNPPFAFILRILSLGLNIAFGIVTLSIPADSDEFRNAGIYYLVSIGLSFLGNYVGVYLFVMVMTIASAVFSLMYMYSFVGAAADSLVDADYGLTDSWDAFRKAYTVMNVGLAAVVVLTFIRFITTSAYLFLILGFSVFAIVLQIWLTILLGKSGSSLTAYSNLPDTEEPETHSRFSSSRNAVPAAGSWVCSCGKVNPGYSHTCGCGKTQSQVARAKAEKRMATRKTSEEKAPNSASSEISEESKKNMELLKELKGLLDQGVITQEEFDSKKAELLKEIK